MSEESTGAAIVLRLVLKDIKKSMAENANNLATTLVLEKLEKKFQKMLEHANKDRFADLLAQK